MIKLCLIQLIFVLFLERTPALIGSMLLVGGMKCVWLAKNEYRLADGDNLTGVLLQSIQIQLSPLSSLAAAKSRIFQHSGKTGH